jgi:pimeloyl-ACP methyl ester carboxylesterase
MTETPRVAPLHPGRWLLLAAVLILGGLALAGWTQTRDGVSVEDVRFRAPDGTVLSALLYRPANATVAAPAPGILAVHGYINTRETQSAFAIEFARRGYVVVALDQRGHGYSRGAATRNGFGGPEGLAYLRSLPFVDRANIGLEGHSMGGWTVLAAAAAHPNWYRAMVLEGSSTGAPFAREGSRTWPRNVAVVFSRFDEFAQLMWGVPSGARVGESAKLQTLFGATAPVIAGRVSGDVAAGTARVLLTPVATHPGDHLSTQAVADAADWFARTLRGGTPRSADDQVWWAKEAGTGLALLGLVALTLGLLDLLLGFRFFTILHRPAPSVSAPRDRRWWSLWWLTALVPAITFYLALLVLPPPLPVSPLFPQAISNWFVVWALVNTVLALLVGRLSRRGVVAWAAAEWWRSALLGGLVVGGLYLVVCAAAAIPLDFRFWVVALRPLAGPQVWAALAYLPAFLLFFAVSARGVAALARHGRSDQEGYALAIGAMATGFLILTGVQYLLLFATGHLPIPAEALNAIVAIQFVPVLAGLAVIIVRTDRRTGSYLPGALIGALFTTWYLVAGTATHFSS